MQKLKFTKMNGCGNDFVIVDYEEFEKSQMNMSDFAKKICDRNFGVGSDGLIIPNLEEKEADIGWYFYNSDGTTAQMCGNGMRCFAKYVFDKKLVSSNKFSVKTLGGIIVPALLEDGLVRVDMGLPILEPEEIPFDSDKNLNVILNTSEREFVVNAISMGNPHCVIFTDENTLEMAKKYGPELEKYKKFPEKTNVEFVKIISKSEVEMNVYERGCGITLACGTGACASVVACILNNLTENKVKVNLLGGSVIVEWQFTRDIPLPKVFLTGPYSYNFFGEFVL